MAVSIRHGGSWAALACALGACAALGACNASGEAPAKAAPPPPEVSVIKATPQPVALQDEYVGQTEAVDTVEIRSRVQGLLQRQAFKDGARVHRGDLLFVIDRQPFETALAQAHANLAQAEASLVNSSQNLERVKRLIADHAVSQQDYEAAVAKQRSDEASVESGRAAVREAELNLDYTLVTAPLDGIASKALVKPGALVSVAQTLLTTLYSVDPIHVNFAVSEDKMLELARERTKRAAPAAAFRVRLVDGSEYPHPGRLDFVDAAVDTKTDTLQVRIAVPNPEQLLRPGQFVRVIAPAPPAPPSILVPQRAVIEMQGLKSVYVVAADGKTASRPITASHRLGPDWVVDRGLEPGELVVVEGVQKITPGSVVKPVLLAAADGARPADAAAPSAPAAPGRAGAGGKAGG
ncbi:MAG TPA: efflux RND transporter periplasmic adaptor subunit [Burkholderiaceae bacterium]